MIIIATASGDYDDYGDDYDVTDTPSCVFSNCKLPNCSCFGVQPNLRMEDRPQLVMLTFDDAITVSNIKTYREIIGKRRNKLDNQPIRLTFFVCHEYNDYELTQELYSNGHEIAVHSISHESNTDLWRRGTPAKWKAEMVGMRTIIGTFGLVPSKEIRGHRAPFLQTAGDTTFDMLSKEGFLYDSSMPTRSFMDPPVWPYTLDYGYSPQDCQIEPCPEKTYPGLWEVPMIQYEMRSRDGVFYCSMADACTPQPKSRKETKEYLMINFRRHYLTNKAPFPLFLHEAWLQDTQRLSGYLDFLDDILTKEDVFVVTVRDVIEYMKNPVKYSNYSSYNHEKPGACGDAKTCRYKEPLRNMKTCAPCPRYYPWIGTPLGRRKPNFIR